MVVVVGRAGQVFIGKTAPFQQVSVAGAAGAAGQALVTGITAPFQHVWVETGGGTVGAGPPFFSQESWPVPSLHWMFAWALGAAMPIRPVNMSESARRSEEAAVKRFITSSKAGASWVKVTLFRPDPRRGQIGISL
ncbi:unannotated protein [freshwater metagenome]|uniref:Unannotated protein n=1 Tax=freshwater metagenome TaxID=449393 RepID=A0A6J6FUX6_9ZZZZ